MTQATHAAIAAVLALTCAPAFAQQLNFENLPGVTTSQDSAVTFDDEADEAKPDCRTAFEVPVGAEDNVPKRVYKCKQGSITITRENPPPNY